MEQAGALLSVLRELMRGVWGENDPCVCVAEFLAVHLQPLQHC